MWVFRLLEAFEHAEEVESRSEFVAEIEFVRRERELRRRVVVVQRGRALERAVRELRQRRFVLCFFETFLGSFLREEFRGVGGVVGGPRRVAQERREVESERCRVGRGVDRVQQRALGKCFHVRGRAR